MSYVTTRNKHSRMILLTLIISMFCLGLAYAEISRAGDAQDGGFFMADRLLGAGGDDPGPWPLWRPIRDHLDNRFHLNSEGELNGDGAAAFALDPRTGSPSVVWAYFDGHDYEIALSRWEAGGWTPMELLTANQMDDLDPRLSFGADGSSFVIWWRDEISADEPSQAWLRERRPQADLWEGTERVNDPVEFARQADVAVDEDAVVWAAYQVEALPPCRVTVSWRQSGAFVFDQHEEIAVSEYQGENQAGGERVNIATQVHFRNGKLWIEWIQDDLHLGFSIHDPGIGWSSPRYEPYRPLVESAGSFKAGLDLARQKVRWRVLRGISR